ncbi:hypothetical protein [Spirosoma flavum]|uniref:Uncharacterized protein n=1 Tax=Spirosoma flavum TaxID=2048557 RepID=A0ABW6APF4_9BACT
MRKILLLVTGLLVSLVTNAQVASRFNYGVIRLGNNMIDSAGFVKILFPTQAAAVSTGTIRSAVSGASGVNYSVSEGIFSINNTYINTLVDNRLKSYDGWDAAVSKVLSTTGTTFKWVVASISSGTTTTGGGNAQVSPRDTALFYADTTMGRITLATMTSLTLTTEAQIRSFLTTNQTNVNATVLDQNLVLSSSLQQTGIWNNVYFHSQTIGGTTFRYDGGSIVFVFTNTHTVNRVKVGGFKIVSHYTGTSYPMFFSNELVGGDGLEIADLDVTSDGNGVYNAIGMSQYSTGSSSGALIKHVWWSRINTHDVGRSNEWLSQGYDYARILGLAITNSRFTNMGLNDQHGFGASLSGLIKGVLLLGNVYTNCRNICNELVNVQYAITMNSTYLVNTANVVTGIGISDDGVNSTKYIYVENNTMNVTGRPAYIYGASYITFQNGGTYTGRYGVDMTSSNCTFKNFTVNVWDKVSTGGGGTSFAWQVDVAASNNLFDNVTISSSNTIGNGGLYAHEVLVVKGSNNTIQNSTLIQGKQSNGTYYGYIYANSGTGNTLTNTPQQNGI